MSPYRPIGVPRIGSAEDRVQAYRRYLDAVAQRIASGLYLGGLQRAYEEETNPDRAAILERRLDELGLRGRYLESQTEIRAALMGMRLCAPPLVLDAADALLSAIGFPNDHDESDTKYFNALGNHEARFLDVACADLAYGPRWWQFLRKRRERQQRAVAQRRALFDLARETVMREDMGTPQVEQAESRPSSG
jgi:hypothetical protein